MIPLDLHESLSDYRQAFSWLLVGIFSAWSGIVRYLIDYKASRQNLTWTGVVTQIFISGFTGFIGGFYGYEEGYSQFMTLIFSGIGGFIGGKLLERLWSKLFNI